MPLENPKGTAGTSWRNITTSGIQRIYIYIIHSRKLTWKPKKGPIKTTVLLKGDYMGFHVSLGECNSYIGS